MAKISSLIEFTGGVGNLVGVKGENGEFYLRRRVRHVHDAQTDAQIVTRAKVALAGSLSNLFPAELLYGMSGSGKRGRRRNWMAEIMQRMTTSTVDGKVRAMLAPADMILSDGRYAYGVTVTNPTIADGHVSMTVTIPEGVERVLVVSAFADGTERRFMSVNSTVATATGSVTLPLPEERQNVANIYIVPISRGTSQSVVSYTSEVGAIGDESVSYSAEVRTYNTEQYEWKHSIFVGTVSAS